MKVYQGKEGFVAAFSQGTDDKNILYTLMNLSKELGLEAKIEHVITPEEKEEVKLLFQQPRLVFFLEKLEEKGLLEEDVA